MKNIINIYWLLIDYFNHIHCGIVSIPDGGQSLKRNIVGFNIMSEEEFAGIVLKPRIVVVERIEGQKYQKTCNNMTKYEVLQG